MKPESTAENNWKKIKKPHYISADIYAELRKPNSIILKQTVKHNIPIKQNANDETIIVQNQRLCKTLLSFYLYMPRDSTCTVLVVWLCNVKKKPNK